MRLVTKRCLAPQKILPLFVLLLGFSLRAGAQTAPVSFPFWCQDLGIQFCMPDQNVVPGQGRSGDAVALEEARERFALLARTPPEQFLPPELAQRVRECQSSREWTGVLLSTRPAAPAGCGRRRPGC